LSVRLDDLYSNDHKTCWQHHLEIMKRQCIRQDHNLPRWNSLDVNILCQIFSFSDFYDLFAIRQTNTQFRQASKHLSARCSSLHFSTLVVQSKAVHKATTINRRNVQISSDLKNDSINVKQAKQPRFRLLNNEQESFVAAFLHDAANFIPGNTSFLKVLDISNLRFITGEMILPKIFQSAKILSSLETLDLSWCGLLISDYIIEATTQTQLRPDHNCINGESLGGNVLTNLRHLYLSGCRRINGSAVSHLVHYFPYLQTFHIAGCSQAIKDDCIMQICKHLPDLTSLNLEGLGNITDTSLIEIFKRLHKLVYLNVNGCKKVRCSFLTQYGNIILRRIENQVDDGNLTNPILDDLISAIRNSNGLSLAALKAYFTDSSSIVNFTAVEDSIFRVQLEVANLCLGLPRRNFGLPKGSLSFFSLTSMGRLRDVDVSGCESVTDTDVQVLAAICSPSLQSLELRGCTIGNSAIKALAFYNCDNLVSLDVSACFKIGDEGVISLCPSVNRSYDVETGRKGCPALTSLKIASLPLLTDRALFAISGKSTNPRVNSNCSSLKQLLLLDVKNCPNVSPHAIESILKTCSSLVELDARDISNTVRREKNFEPKHLVIFNGKRQNRNNTMNKNECSNCCTAVTHSQRLKLKEGKELHRMFYCKECNLLPSYNRGICSACAVHCHNGHVGVYFSSVTSFYCDCFFGFQPHGKQCSFHPSPSESI